MTRYSALITILVLVCLMMLGAVVAQRHELLGLREEKLNLLARLTGTADNSKQALLTESDSTRPPIGGITVSPELLRLRNQVSLLTRRRQELAGIRSENERLRLLFAERQTNPPSALPPGYIRKSQARLVGYNTPDDTLQSFLWALQNRDATNVLLAFTPEMARWFQAQAQRSGSLESLFEHSEALIGFSIVSTQRFDDGTLQADIEIVPGLPTIPVNLHKIGNEWKITSLP